MELTRLVRSSGFFLSSIVTIGMGILFLLLIQSTLISLWNFTFLIPLFLAGILLRASAWRRLYLSSKDKLYFITSLFVFIFGLALLVGFIIYASMQTILFPLQDYSGDFAIIGLSCLWLVYSLTEFVSLYGIFKKAVFKYIRFLIAPIVLIEASLLFLLGQFVYILPISVFLLAGITTMAGFGFLFDDAEIK